MYPVLLRDLFCCSTGKKLAVEVFFEQKLWRTLSSMVCWLVRMIKLFYLPFWFIEDGIDHMTLVRKLCGQLLGALVF